LRLPRELFSDLNNVKECNIDTPLVSKYYGFMESELNELLTKYGVDEAMKSGIKQRYNGYTTDVGPIYNVWSTASKHIKIIKGPEGKEKQNRQFYRATGWNQARSTT
jgi:hypothetical protein